jgi:cytochrome c oxidase assembly factor CtaG
MSTALWTSWSLQPQVAVPLLLLAAVYTRGWLLLRRHGQRQFQPRHLACFLGSLATIWAAVASPLDPFGTFLLQIHMVQHLLLLLVAAPLLWLARPELPLLLGLPGPIRQRWIVPLLRLRWVHAALRCATRPAVAWTVFVVSFWLWHAPQLFELTLETPSWHYLEHACFFGAGLLFWFPVIQPYPSRPQLSRWMLLPYLFAAELQGTMLSALLTFADHVLYPHYARVPRLWEISALTDQALAGAIMWILGSIAFVIPLVWIGHEVFYGRPGALRHGQRALSWPIARLLLPSVPPAAGRAWTFPGHDLLRLPAVGRFLRWRHARLAMQLPLLALAAVVVLDGLLGPQVAALNLAGVLPWIVWRGLLVFGLLLAGNLFCMACPFMLVRGFAKRWLPGNRPWPPWLAGKWPAVMLLVTFFWAYEALALWDSPQRTACVAIAYFAVAFAVDGFFRSAAFCKHACPVGQFNFVNALMSPLEVRVRDPKVCDRCTTKDCICGRDGIPGCERLLFQPRKRGNMDCTFALDCVHACPHDNVGILTVVPGADLIHDPPRSGIGRFSQRTDLATMVLLLVFAAFLNAAEMIGPVLQFEDALTAWLGLASPILVVTAETLLGLVVLPALAVAAVALASRRLGGGREGVLAIVRRFAYSLAPLGFGMWLAHYSFHFFTTAGAVVPAARRLARDLGFSVVGAPPWEACCATKMGDWLLILQIGLLDLGLLGSLYAAYRIAQDGRPPGLAALRAFVPWAALLVLLFAIGIWILFQPMQMRGMVMSRLGGMG